MSSNEMTIEQARAKLGDLVIAAMRGESTVITRYGKPRAQIVPIEEPAMQTQDLAYQISLTLGDHVADFDIDGIVEEIGDTYGRDIPDLDAVPADEYWTIVKRHDTTAVA
jgi:prevent-host-death family protein